MRKKLDDLETWLDKHGGRSISDLEKDEQGLWYVHMWSGNKHTYYRYFLPKHLQ